jgi:hypothetical protein
MHTELENTLKNFILNKELSHIEFYTINDKYWVFDEEKVWVLDCGIQLSFGDEVFAFAWNKEKGFYEHHIGRIEEITADIETKGLHATEIEGIRKLIGKKITDVKFQWNFYHDLDENFEPKEEKNYMPMEILLTFENESVLQLAGINFEVDTENKKIFDVTFDSTGDLLITLNHPIEIINEDPEE